MGRRGPRQVVFVCSAIINGKLVTEMIEQETSDEAQRRFTAKHHGNPETILGPFYRKRTGVLLSSSGPQIKLTGKTRPAIYNEWYVKALGIQDGTCGIPEECVWVFFDIRVDGKKQPKPQSFIMKAEELTFLNADELVTYKAMQNRPAV